MRLDISDTFIRILRYLVSSAILITFYILLPSWRLVNVAWHPFWSHETHFHQSFLRILVICSDVDTSPNGRRSPVLCLVGASSIARPEP